MNTTKKHRSLLKTLPIISLLMAALTLSPAIVHAEKDHGYNKPKYSHDRGRLHNNRDSRNHNKHAYNDHGRSHGKHQKEHRSHKPKHHRNNWRGYTSKHRYNKHDNHGHRSHRPVYVVNDHHYDDHYIGLNRLGFMLGIHTGNFDISFHD